MLPFAKPTIGLEEKAAVAEVLETGWLTSGPKVAEFEAALAEYIGGGVGVRVFNSATSALEATLLGLNLRSGDEVIVPAMSFAASANVVLRAGAVPRFVDVDLVTRNVQPEWVAAALTSRTRAIMPVHFAGRAAPVESLYELAAPKGIVVVEDAAQAIGSSSGVGKVGSMGNPSCFSFHPNKNMTTIEGGALASADRELLGRVERIRFHGIEKNAAGEVDVAQWGGKMNLPDVGAALGLVQLRRLDQFNRRRRALALRYLERLPRNEHLVLPEDVAGHSWHMFCVSVDFDAIGVTRAALQEQLASQGIATGTHYPAIHLFSLYRGFGYRPGQFPNAERIADQTVTLPLFPGMSEADVDRVSSAVSGFFQ